MLSTEPHTSGPHPNKLLCCWVVLCSKRGTPSSDGFVVLLPAQAAESQQYASSQKELQDQVKALQKTCKQHEQACSKAEVGAT